uniref:Uncharacterized protein n=1 Tax=Phaeomonas parva TaxID=124430 RepID=A0A6U4LIK6_9STRA|mmetsp:Transcript_8590/g.24861  ORF Transcript_8590/g.24861 Transcript_8590/m.24861 type:complete len:308 (+) Transcript_8590:167-1090(+)
MGNKAGKPAAASPDSSLEERYAAIKAAQGAQFENYTAWIAGKDAAWREKIVADAAALGIDVDVDKGQIRYAADFEEKKLPLKFDLMYCRHGKTTGNTEPRVYQGYVDEPSNALNDVGKGQAEAAADKLDALRLDPDLVVLSPLSRAADTGRAYLKRHPELEAVTEEWDESAEMHFGAWDNVRVRDLPDDNICHLFYLDQNAVVVADAPYKPPSGGAAIPGESFVEVLVRMHGVLEKLNARFQGDAPAKQPLVLMYGHSMAGAALSVLTGNGKVVDGQTYLGFDGKYIMPNATPVYLHREKGGACIVM